MSSDIEALISARLEALLARLEPGSEQFLRLFAHNANEVELGSCHAYEQLSKFSSQKFGKVNFTEDDHGR